MVFLVLLTHILSKKELKTFPVMKLGGGGGVGQVIGVGGVTGVGGLGGVGGVTGLGGMGQVTGWEEWWVGGVRGGEEMGGRWKGERGCWGKG